MQIPAPEGLGKKDRVVQVSVGNESAWVVSSEGKVSSTDKCHHHYSSNLCHPTNLGE